MKDCQCSTSGLLLIVSEPCNQLFGGTEESTSRPSSFDSKGFFDLPSEQGNPLDPSSQGLIPRYSGSIEGRIDINEPIDEYNTQAEHYQAGEHAFIPYYDFQWAFQLFQPRSLIMQCRWSMLVLRLGSHLPNT